MPRDLKHFLVVICEDRVVAYSTNILGFHRELKKINAINHKIQSYSSIKKYFKNERVMDLAGKDRKIYVLQKVL